MQYQIFNDTWEDDDVMDEDWPPKEEESENQDLTDKVTSFVMAVLRGTEDGSTTFTCPICGHQAYRHISRKYSAAKCDGCGMSLMT